MRSIPGPSCTPNAESAAGKPVLPAELSQEPVRRTGPRIAQNELGTARRGRPGKPARTSPRGAQRANIPAQQTGVWRVSRDGICPTTRRSARNRPETGPKTLPVGSVFPGADGANRLRLNNRAKPVEAVVAISRKQVDPASPRADRVLRMCETNSCPARAKWPDRNLRSPVEGQTWRGLQW